MANTTKTFTATGLGTWIAPNGITTVQAEAWGGGGGAGAATTGEAGGGGGAYAIGSALAVVAYTGYAYNVGTSGPVNAIAGSSWFTGTTTVFAPGGINGNGTTGGAGGTAGVGTPKNAGGLGGNGSSFFGAAGGGAGANSGQGGTGGFGVSGGGTGGTAGVGAGGGGHGGGSNAVGTAGTAPGGGGGGGGTKQNGAAGAAGQIKLVYTTPLGTSLQDDWETGAISTSKWSGGGGSVAVSANQLVISNTTAVNYFALSSIENYDLTSSQVSNQLVNAGNQALPTHEAYPLQLIADVNNTYEYVISGNVTTARFKSAGAGTNIGTIAYNSTNQQYFRIRESIGTSYWDYSADGINWTNLGSRANPITITSMQLQIQTGNFAIEASTTSMTTDNFNVLPNAVAASPYRALLGVGT